MTVQALGFAGPIDSRLGAANWAILRGSLIDSRRPSLEPPDIRVGEGRPIHGFSYPVMTALRAPVNPSTD
jgi:hypothetical protein